MPIAEELQQEFAGLPPLQQLTLEVLAARYRLGHEMWTFKRSDGLTKAMTALKERKLLEPHSGVVEGTVRASLTDRGINMMLDPEYVPARVHNPQRELR
jgi:hypothetical protein